MAAASLTGLPLVHMDFDLPIPRILHTDCPHHYRFCLPGETEEAFAARLAENLEKLILREGPDTVAAFIAEPVMGTAGVIIPPRTYFERIDAVLRKYEVLFIDDEVICGFGRTGNPFGCQTYGFTPDTVSVAKAFSSAYLPIGAVLVPEVIYEAMLEESRKVGLFGHGFTYSGHPVCASVALRNLQIMEERRIFEHARFLSPHFQKRLAAFGDHPLVGETRGVGRAREHGLIVRGIGDTMAFCPPLIITEDEIDELFARFSRALDDTEAWVAKEGLRTA